MHRPSLTLALFVAMLAPVQVLATSPTDVLGTWQTGIAEQPAPDGSTAYLQLTTSFTEETQDLIVRIFADEALQIPLFKYHSGGPWDPQGASAAVPGAMEVDMNNDFSRVEIFVDAPELWAALNMADCPLEIGVAVEVADCVDGPPFIVTNCTDMDLVMVDQDSQRLRYGGGDVDRCEVRPTEMSDDEFFKVN